MTDIPCHECRQCNQKGKPSVTRNSAYCNSHVRHGVIVNRSGLFQKFRDFITERRFDDKENKLKTTKGFRPSWFWR